MSDLLITRVLTDIHERNEEINAEQYTMVNVRPGEKISAMLDVMTHLTSKTPSAIISNRLSAKLAEFAASSTEYENAALDALERALTDQKYLSDGCALDLLGKIGLIECDRPPNPFVRKISFVV